MKKFHVTVQSEIILTSQDIDDIISTEFDGGGTHWIGQVEVVGDYLGEYASEQISRGGRLILHDAESDDTWTLTLDNFLDGFRQWLEEGLDRYGAVYGGEVDTAQIDGTMADIIIQYALFGEYVFG
jgi:hypothetical protein